MTNWRAVGIGVATEIGFGILSYTIHWIGFVVVTGLAGGIVAGYLADNGVRSSGWHGSLVGAVIMAILVGATTIQFIIYFPLAAGDVGLGPIFIVFAVFLGLGLIILGGIAGAIGGIVPRSVRLIRGG